MTNQILNQIQVIVLAAGKGSRMQLINKSKMLADAGGKSMVRHVLDKVEQSKISTVPVVVVGYQADEVKGELGDGYEYVYQDKLLGTGHAVACARQAVLDDIEHILVLYGNHPLITVETINRIIEKHIQFQAVITMATCKVDDFKDWRGCFQRFGRIIRDKGTLISQIVEIKNAITEEMQVTEVNPGYYCFQSEWLWQNISKLDNQNNQKEFLLTDLLEIAFQQNKLINDLLITAQEGLGINTPEDLEVVKKFLIDK